MTKPGLCVLAVLVHSQHSVHDWYVAIVSFCFSTVHLIINHCVIDDESNKKDVVIFQVNKSSSKFTIHLRMHIYVETAGEIILLNLELSMNAVSGAMDMCYILFNTSNNLKGGLPFCILFELSDGISKAFRC